MAKDNFDDLIESEVREAKRPKQVAPQGMVGTSASRPTAPSFRLTAPTESTTAKFFYGLGIFSVLATLLLAFVAYQNAGIAAAVYVLIGGAISAGWWFAIAGALEYLNAAAHWSEQTAKAIAHQATAAKKD